MADITDEQIAAAVRPLYADDTAASMGLADDIRTVRAVLALQPSASAEPVAWRIRYRSEPGMIGHYPWSYTERKPKTPRPEHEVEPVYASPVTAAREQEASATGAEPVAWRYKDSRGHWRYRGYKANFDVEYSILKPEPLYATPTTSTTGTQFPRRIVALLQEVAEGPFEDGNGECLMEDAKKALAWLTTSTTGKVDVSRVRAPDIPPGCEMARGWCVQVSVYGETILTIEEQALSGVTDLDPWASTIRGCAEHLQAFIGPAGGGASFDPDAPLETGEADAKEPHPCAHGCLHALNGEGLAPQCIVGCRRAMKEGSKK